MQKALFLKRATEILLFVNVFFIESTFRVRAYDDKSVDLQVLLKMGLWAFTFFFCLFYYRVWAKKLLRIDNVFQVFLLILIFISCFYAPNLVYSLGAAFSLFAVIFLLLLSSEVLSNRELIRQIIFGCTLVAVISILVYFIDPEFGRMKEWRGGTHVIGTRLMGISGAANTSGYIAALCLLALYYYRQYLPRRLPATYWIFVLINIVALIMSNSRTSMIAMALSIVIAGVFSRSPARIAFACLGLCAGIIVFSLIDLDTFFAMLARSGEASEITTGTGRTQIWAASLRLIAERPFFGWGYAAPNYILPAASGEIGFTINQAHNALLQVALSVGLVGLFFFIALMVIKIYYSIKSGQQLNIAFISFLMIDGLTEAVAFQGVATTTTLALATVLALNYGDANEASRIAYQQRLPRPAPA